MTNRARALCRRDDRYRNFWLTLALSMLAALIIMGGAAMTQATELSNSRIITVSGKGVVTAIPDIARITAGVTSTGKTASEALQANNGDMRDVIATLKRAGIAAKDIQTSNLSVQPRQQHYRDGRPPRVTGYQVTNQVHLTVRKIDDLGAVLDDIVTAGANQIHGISFDVSNAGKVRDDARGQAIKDARRKAELYAAAAGARVGQIISISEQGGGGHRPPVMARQMAAEAVPVERGSKTLEVRVSASWALE